MRGMLTSRFQAAKHRRPEKSPALVGIESGVPALVSGEDVQMTERSSQIRQGDLQY